MGADRYPKHSHFAVCQNCFVSWRLEYGDLDRALESIASHFCPHSIISGPNSIEIQTKPIASFTKANPRDI